MKSMLLLLLISFTQAPASEGQSKKKTTLVDSERDAVVAIQSLGGRVTIGNDGQLSIVNLRGTRVADGDIPHLTSLHALRILFLNETQISDTGLEQLHAVETLRVLHIRGTQVTDEGVRAFKKAIPACRVIERARPTSMRRRSPTRIPASFTTSATSVVNQAQVLVLESVRGELQLDDEQRQAIDAVLTNWAAEETKTANQLGNAQSREEGGTLFRNSREGAETAWNQILAILSDEQQVRFEQLRLQKSGFRVFVSPPARLFSQLSVTEEQHQQFSEIYADWDSRYGLPRRGTKSWDRLMERFLAVFDARQRQEWDTMVGETFDFRDRSKGNRIVSFEVPNLGSDARLLKEKWIRLELEISDKQTQQMNAALNQWKQMLDEFENRLQTRLPNQDGEELHKSLLALADSAVDLTDQITGVLTEEQRARLEQIKLQRKGLRVFMEPSVRGELDFTRGQFRSISRIIQGASPRPSPPGIDPPKEEEGTATTMNQVLELLTHEQRVLWDSMIGKPVEIPVKHNSINK